MINLTEKDFAPLEQFNLKWRWTDPKWNQFSSPTLSKIQPLQAATAKELWKDALTLRQGSRLNPNLFSQVTQIDTTNPRQTVQEWLYQRGVDQDQTIFLFWDQQTAVVTKWEVFYEYWDDFCYPSSDDVTIWPISKEWALCYYHSELFCFGRRRV